MKISELFDGETHWLVPGELFPEGGAAQVIVDWEELEEEDELSPFEAPSMEPILADKRASYKYDNRPELADVEQAWGSFSIALTSFAQICGFEKKQYQHGTKAESVQWSFATTEHITERM